MACPGEEQLKVTTNMVQMALLTLLLGLTYRRAQEVPMMRGMRAWEAVMAKEVALAVVVPLLVRTWTVGKEKKMRRMKS